MVGSGAGGARPADFPIARALLEKRAVLTHLEGMERKRASLTERFWAKVKKGHPNDCWLWTANKNNHGYGLIRQGGMAPKKLAHRVSYEIHYGPIRENPHLHHGNVVMHSCDNPSCVNPAHLRLGTQAINTRDMDEKRRRRTVSNVANLGPPRKGEDHPFAKLTNASVAEIKKRRAAGETFVSIAKDFGVHKSTVRKALLTPNWKT
jgi:hypothetical protein